MIGMFEEEKVGVTVYADESMNRKCLITNTSWDYMCLCFVSSYEIFNIINCLRFNRGQIIDNYEVDSQDTYFEKNNLKLHFQEINSADKFHIAKRFLEWVVDVNSTRFVKFLILGINRTKIDESKFGQKKIFENIYNRFFRSSLSYGLKRFYNHENVTIENIFHEDGGQKEHEYFPFHAIFKLKNQYDFKCEEINFIGKNHIQNPHANITQLCDLMLGVTTHIIHNAKGGTYKDQLADIALPLIKRSITEAKNLNSRYNHRRRFVCSFFPKNEIIMLDGQEVWDSEFYSERPLNYLISQSSQLKLNI